ncbi:hypothetical protein HanPI659440_Chr09g0349951 [Helianthus annuus]|nr:hypothetical protein HanPI659440_Chr09g0349951 [Helianthus annuus]
MPSWEELDRKLALGNLIKPADENLFNYPAEALLPVNLEPAIPNPIVNPQPLPGALEEWWTTDWQFQNLINNPNTFFPQFDPEPAPNPPISNENLAELRHYGEELVDAGNRIRVVGEQISWKYDKRERLSHPEISELDVTRPVSSLHSGSKKLRLLNNERLLGTLIHMGSPIPTVP